MRAGVHAGRAMDQAVAGVREQLLEEVFEGHKVPPVEADFPGIKAWTTRDGLRVIELHYTADPRKRTKEWEEEARRGMTKSGWNREMELNWTVEFGSPVHSDFNRTLHVSSTGLKADPLRPIYCGWDFGLNPCIVVTQISATGRWLVLDSYIGQEIALDPFLRRIAGQYGPNWGAYQQIHFVDPSGFKRSETDERSCIEIMRSHGFTNIHPGAVSAEKRRSIIDKKLSELVDGRAAMIIDPRNDLIIEAFDGGYHWLVVQGQTKEEPDKNQASHPMDALQYVATGLFMIRGNKSKKRDRPKAEYVLGSMRHYGIISNTRRRSVR